MDWTQITLYNLVFWAVWYQVSLVPERVMQNIIDKY